MNTTGDADANYLMLNQFVTLCEPNQVCPFDCELCSLPMLCIRC